MDYIINHKRFKKKYSFNELDKYLWSEKRISKFPHSIVGYFEFFNDYAKKNNWKEFLTKWENTKLN